jgi:alkylhydroperoxidase family enzyme
VAEAAQPALLHDVCSFPEVARCQRYSARHPIRWCGVDVGVPEGMEPMSRIVPLEVEEAEPEARAELERQLEAHGRVTNMKRTLAHSPTALHALMTWYPLRDRVAAFLGERATTLFAQAISSGADCLICSTFFRRVLVESGEDPDSPVLDERQQAVVDYGVQLVRDSNAVSDALYGRLEAFLTPPQLVDLTAFGALMIATNVVNNALLVDLDGYLEPYRRDGAAVRP